MSVLVWLQQQHRLNHSAKAQLQACPMAAQTLVALALRPRNIGLHKRIQKTARGNSGGFCLTKNWNNQA